MEEGAANGQVDSVPEAPSAPAAEPTKVTTKSRQNVFVGRVASNKMDKTVVVRVEKVKRHRLYRRNIHYHVKYYAHDEKNACTEGDVVRIVETRPISRLKRWRVVDILEKGGVEPRRSLVDHRSEESSDSEPVQAKGGRQHRRARGHVHPRDGRLESQDRHRRRRDHGRREVRRARRLGEEGRGPSRASSSGRRKSTPGPTARTSSSTRTRP